MRLLTSVFVTLILFSCAKRPLSPQEFALAYKDRLKELLPSAQLSIKTDSDGELFIITFAGGDSVRSYIYNAYRLYLATPDSLRSILDIHCENTITLATSPSKEFSPSSVIAALKELTFIQQYSMYSVPFVGDLGIVFATDDETSIQYARISDFSNLSISKDQLVRTAIRNFIDARPEPIIEDLGGVFRLHCEGGFLPSMLLDTTFWWQMRDKVDGEILVAVPAREFLYFTGSGKLANIYALRKLQSEVAQKQPYRLSDSLFVFQNGKFEVHRR